MENAVTGTRKKPGPKPRPSAQVREQCQVRLLPSERVAFEKAASAMGLGVSAWLRMVGLMEIASPRLSG